LFGQAFVVAIALALVSSLVILPAFYASFLKKDALKYLSENEANGQPGEAHRPSEEE
jgi:hypothetical protein